MEETDEQRSAIKLEYASTFTRSRTTRILGVICSLFFAAIGIILAGPGCALMFDAISHWHASNILPAMAMIAGGAVTCFAAWFIQKRYVFPVG